MMIVTAAFIFFSLASFSTIYNTAPCDFTIGADSFRASYSHSFWLALATGKNLFNYFSQYRPFDKTRSKILVVKQLRNNVVLDFRFDVRCDWFDGGTVGVSASGEDEGGI